MNAPLLWFIIPFFFGAFLLLFSESKKLSIILASTVCLFLIAISATVPINSMVIIGKNSIIFTDSMEILGRTLSLERATQPLLAFFYSYAFIWILFSAAVRVSSLFCTAGFDGNRFGNWCDGRFLHSSMVLFSSNWGLDRFTDFLEWKKEIRRGNYSLFVVSNLGIDFFGDRRLAGFSGGTQPFRSIYLEKNNGRPSGRFYFLVGDFSVSQLDRNTHGRKLPLSLGFCD